MPLKITNSASLQPKTAETVEAVGITLPVHPYLLTAEKLTLASMEEDMNSPVFLLRAFTVFTHWRCKPEDRVDFDTLAQANLTSDELGSITQAVARIFAAANEDEREKGKPTETPQNPSTT